MPLIRSIEQSKLSELYAVGQGMLLRYRDLCAGDTNQLATPLAEIIDRRQRLLQRLADAQQARGELPPAGDQERNDWHALVDRIAGALLGESTLQQRLLRAEEDWRTLLRDAQELDWNGHETELLQALRRCNDGAIEAFRDAIA